jgi:hypothetical protein
MPSSNFPVRVLVPAKASEIGGHHRVVESRLLIATALGAIDKPAHYSTDLELYTGRQ